MTTMELVGKILLDNLFPVHSEGEITLKRE